MTGTSPDKREPSGVLLLDKPPGPTSHDVVRQVRSAMGMRRVGHTGTLDPFASGLLILCLGRATRLVEYFHLLPKTYRGIALLGVRTDTDDRTGRVTATSDTWRGLTTGMIRDAAGRLVGEQGQRPPAFSAKKIRGRRAFEVARLGGEPQLAPVVVAVHRFHVTAVRGPEVAFEAEVSTGTYVRALARDLGEELGCHAHLTELRRERVGPFDVREAAAPRELETPGWPPPGWMTPAAALAWLPERQLSQPEVERIEVGQSISEPAVGPDSGLPVRLLAGERLVAVARRTGGRLKPEKVFPEE